MPLSEIRKKMQIKKYERDLSIQSIKVNEGDISNAFTFFDESEINLSRRIAAGQKQDRQWTY